MANSYVKYTGDGSQTSYTVPFPYLDTDHVKALLDGVETTDFSWTSTNTIEFFTAPGNGVEVQIRRITPKTALVTFDAMSRGRSSAFNLLRDQILYIGEEAEDQYQLASNSADAALDSEQAAATSETNAAASEAAAAASETNASTSETNAAASASAASTSEANAAASEAAAANSAAAAEASSDTAADHEGQAALLVEDASGRLAYNTKADLQASNVPPVVEAINLLGYSSAGDGGGAQYKRTMSEPRHAGKIQSSDGAWWEIAEEVLNPRMFGAAGDGTTNDTASFIALGTASAEHEVYIPAGTFLLRNQITFNDITIRGAGKEVTKLVWDGSATAVGLKVVLSDIAARVSVRDLSFQRIDVQNNGTALHFDGTAQVVAGNIVPRWYNRAGLHNVEFLNDGTVDGGASFAVGAHFESILGSEVTGFSFAGSYTTGDATDNLGTALRFNGAGLPVSPHLRGITVYRCATALDIFHHEGVLLSQFEFVAVNKGVVWRTDGSDRKPHLVVSDGHMNIYDRGVDAEKADQATIHDVVFYRRPDATSSTFYHILLNSCRYSHIHSNVFADVGSPVEAVDIRLMGGFRNTVGVNTHQIGDTAISVSASESETQIEEQNGNVSAYATWIADSGTQSKKPGLRTTTIKTVAQTVTGANTAIVWDATLVQDSAGMWSAVNPTRLVAHRTGIFNFQYNIVWDSNATGSRRVALFKNGTIMVPGAAQRSAAVAFTEQSGAVLGVALTKGDYIEVKVLQNSGADRDILVNTCATLMWVSD